MDLQVIAVIVRRFEAAAGLAATLVGTGETFQVLEARRAREAAEFITLTLLFARDLGLLHCLSSPTRH